MTHASEGLPDHAPTNVRHGPVLTTKQAADYVGLKPHTLQVMSGTELGRSCSRKGA